MAFPPLIILLVTVIIMHVLIAYDISDNRSRRKFFNYLREKGLPSQKSVFECDMNREDIRSAHTVAKSLNLQAQDSVVVYPLCRHCSRRAILLGQGLRIAPADWTVI